MLRVKLRRSTKYDDVVLGKLGRECIRIVGEGVEFEGKVEFTVSDEDFLCDVELHLTKPFGFMVPFDTRGVTLLDLPNFKGEKASEKMKKYQDSERVEMAADIWTYGQCFEGYKKLKLEYVFVHGLLLRNPYWTALYLMICVPLVMQTTDMYSHSKLSTSVQEYVKLALKTLRVLLMLPRVKQTADFCQAMYCVDRAQQCFIRMSEEKSWMVDTTTKWEGVVGTVEWLNTMAEAKDKETFCVGWSGLLENDMMPGLSYGGYFASWLARSYIASVAAVGYYGLQYAFVGEVDDWLLPWGKGDGEKRAITMEWGGGKIATPVKFKESLGKEVQKSMIRWALG